MINESKALVFDRLMKSRSVKNENFYFELLDTFNNVHDFMKELLSTTQTRKRTHMTKDEWQRRLAYCNPNFELIDMSKKELVIRCRHCGAIFIRTKASLRVAYCVKSKSYCKCCQKRNGVYKDKVDYTAVMKPHPTGKLVTHVIDAEKL